jgi:predicted nucleic acid-binding protein
VLIVDTGVLLAATDAADPDHDACGRVLATETGRLVTTALVIAEAAYLIDRQLGPAAEADFFRAVAAGEIVVEPLSGPAPLTNSLISPSDAHDGSHLRGVRIRGTAAWC